MAKKKKVAKKAAKKIAKSAKPKKKVAKKAVKKIAKPVQPKKKVAKKAAKKVAKSAQPKKKIAKKTPPVKISKLLTPKPEAKSLEPKETQPLPQETLVVEEEIILEEEVFLTDAEGNRYCRGGDCDQLAMVEGYCRYHYLLFWKKIQVRKKILAGGKLEGYIQELTSRYSDKFVELLRKDLRTEKDFLAAVHELELDQDESEMSNDEEEETSNFIEEIRGVATESSKGRDDDY